MHLLAFGFGAGLAGKAPGTFGTLVALPVYAVMTAFPVWLYIVIVFLMAITGIWLCERTSRDMAVHDPGGIVWDEIVGMLCALIALPPNVILVTLAFVVFRLLDILKPWPINKLDESVKGGLGIMLDDILAGLITCGILQGVLALGWLSGN